MPVIALRREQQRRGERGIAMVLVALVLVILMLFAAFAIDFGALYNYRREDQNAADGAALAAAQDLNQPVATMVATAKAYVEDTLDRTFTAAQWNSCGADGGSLLNLAAGSNCVSYDTERVRVRVPDQQYDTFFASVAGIDSFRHSAFAVAGLENEGFGGVLPFGVTGTSGDGGFGCLQSNSEGQASAVCGSVTGNFRFLDFGQFGSATLNTTNNCGNGTQEQRIQDNIAMGVDHTLSIFGTTYSTEVVDTEACVPPQVTSPNAMFTRTGNQSTEATIGLFSGVAANFSDGDPARLARSSDELFGGAAPAKVDVLGVQDLDNTPLWLFIPSGYGPTFGNADIPSSCERNQFVDGSGDFSIANTPADVQTFLAGRTQGDQSIALLQRCISHYMGQDWTGFPIGTISPAELPNGCTGPCDDPIFASDTVDTDPQLYDIQHTPRFGYVPLLNAFGSGNSISHIDGFRAVFIQRLLIETSGSGNLTWDPGVSPAPPTSGGFQRLGETSVFVFPPGSLPNGLADTNAPFQIGLNRFVRLVR